MSSVILCSQGVDVVGNYYVADEPLQEGSSKRYMYIVGNHSNHHKHNVMSLAYANNNRSTVVMFHCLCPLIHLPHTVNIWCRCPMDLERRQRKED